jgi:hypothetical protein
MRVEAYLVKMVYFRFQYIPDVDVPQGINLFKGISEGVDALFFKLAHQFISCNAMYGVRHTCLSTQGRSFFLSCQWHSDT